MVCKQTLQTILLIVKHSMVTFQISERLGIAGY